MTELWGDHILYDYQVRITKKKLEGTMRGLYLLQIVTAHSGRRCKPLHQYLVAIGVGIGG